MKRIVFIALIVIAIIPTYLYGADYYVKEKTTAYLTLTFRDQRRTLVTPTAGTYRIDDSSSKSNITPLTAFTPSSSSYVIEISADENRMLDEKNDKEYRIVTVTWTYSGGKQGTEFFIYYVQNLQYISSE